MLLINEDPYFSFTEICIALGLTDSPLKLVITDPSTLQWVKITMWRMNNKCNCLNNLQSILTKWKGCYIELQPMNQTVAHCCTELLLAASKSRKKPKVTNWTKKVYTKRFSLEPTYPKRPSLGPPIDKQENMWWKILNFKVVKCFKKKFTWLNNFITQ